MSMSAQGGDSITAEARRGGELALEMKAQDVVCLDLRGISSAADFFLIATGRSDVQVKAIAERIREGFRESGMRPQHVEGVQGGHWVLMDYVDLVVHIFHPQARAFYQLEALWGDAPRILFEAEGPQLVD